MAREGGFFSPGGSSFSTNQSGDGTQVAGFFSKKKEVPTKKFKGIKGITAKKDAINSQTYRDMGDESMADEFKKKYNIDPRDYMNLQSKRFVSPSGNEVGQIASATTDLSGLVASSDFDKQGYDSFLQKDFGVDSDSSIYKSFPNRIKMDLRNEFKEKQTDGQLVNQLPKNYGEQEQKVIQDNQFNKYYDNQFGDVDPGPGLKQFLRQEFDEGNEFKRFNFDQSLKAPATDTKVAMLGGDNLGGYGALGIAGGIFGLGLKGIQSAIEGGRRLKENIEKRVNPEKNQVSIGDRVGGFLNSMMGISPVAAGTLDAQPKQVGYQPVGPKLNYVNPDAKTMSLKQIGEAFKPSNLFGYKDKYGKYDDPGSPLDRQRQETMQRVYNRFTRPMTPDARTIGQIRADQEATMRDNARLRYQNFQDRRALGPAANIQKTFGADSTYNTGVPSNPAMGFSGKMDADAQAKYAKAAREATAGAQTDPSLGNVFTQTYNRIASRFGLPQKNLQTVDQRQLKKAQEAYNRPRVQQEAYARKMLGITNDMVKADNMQRIRLNAFARNQAFKAERAQKAAERAAKRLGGNIGTGRDGSPGLGTSGQSMPSNPKGFSGYSRRKSSPGTGTSTSTSKSGISKSRSRGQGPGSSSSRSKGGTGTGKSGQGSKSSARGAKGSSSSRSKGGVSKGGKRGSVGRGGRRGGRRCDIRTKIDITSLTNQNLMRDDLATVAYFVQEIKGE